MNVWCTEAAFMTQLFVWILYIIGTFIFHSLIYISGKDNLPSEAVDYSEVSTNPAIPAEAWRAGGAATENLPAPLWTLRAHGSRITDQCKKHCQPVSRAQQAEMSVPTAPQTNWQRHPRCFYTRRENNDSNDAHQQSIVGIQGCRVIEQLSMSAGTIENNRWGEEKQLQYVKVFQFGLLFAGLVP